MFPLDLHAICSLRTCDLHSTPTKQQTKKQKPHAKLKWLQKWTKKMFLADCKGHENGRDIILNVENKPGRLPGWLFALANCLTTIWKTPLSHAHAKIQHESLFTSLEYCTHQPTSIHIICWHGTQTSFWTCCFPCVADAQKHKVLNHKIVSVRFGEIKTWTPPMAKLSSCFKHYCIMHQPSKTSKR